MPFLKVSYRIWTSMLVLLMLVLVARFTYTWSSQHAYEELGQQNRNELYRFSSSLRAILEKYESVPHQLSINPELSHFLGDKRDPVKTGRINKYLKSVNRINRSSAVYLLDSLGNTVAASNFDTPISFVGKNFSFRPYFTEAMQGRNARYFALGTTSNKRGYYFASPVSDADDILGVVVLKISLTEIEKSWASPWGQNTNELLVTDDDGVIFISTIDRWRLQSLEALRPEQMKKLVASKRYADHLPKPIGVQSRELLQGDFLQGASLISVKENSGRVTRYLMQNLDMPFAGWRVSALSRTDYVAEQVRNAMWISLSACILLGLLILFVIEHMRNERKLKQAKDQLEIRVSERTADLEATNKQLVEEIEGRHKTEQALEKTQEELIQAAKMAVLGQISAGINHELNQPLTAIRSYSQNCQQFLEKGRIAAVSGNLSEIIALTDHMASIIAQLKVFARKGSGLQPAPVSVSDGVRAAIKIMSVQARREGIQIHVDCPDTDILVEGDLVQLEQVFINLIANACQAMTDQTEKQITIRVRKKAAAEAGTCFIEFEDSGCGIDEQDLDHIFEPFYTTKSVQQGLGLGLSICHRIVESMSGKLVAGNVMGSAVRSGAVFQIILPLASVAGDAKTRVKHGVKAEVKNQ